MLANKFTQISVPSEFIQLVEGATEHTGTSLLSFIKLSVISMSTADQQERVASIANLRVAEATWGSDRIKKTLRVTPDFKAQVVDALVGEFENNASLLFRASALRMSKMNKQNMKSEINKALDLSIRHRYRIR